MSHDLISEYLGGYRFLGYWDNSKQRTKSGYQFKVFSKEEAIDRLEFLNGICNCGITVTTYIHNTPYLLYLPFDFDSPDLRKSWDDASKLYNFFAKANYDVMIDYSGSKGFHVFVKTVPKVYTKNQIKWMQKFFAKHLNLETADERIMGDVRRLMRIPGTFHKKGTLCHTIKQSGGSKLLDINKFVKSNVSVKEYYSNDNNTKGYDDYSIGHEYPCIEYYARNKQYWLEHHPRKSFEPPHKPIRFAWVILRMIDGKTDDEIVDEIKQIGWWDFDEYKTRYQLRQIRRRGYKLPSCKTLKDGGFCLDSCPHNTNNWNGISINIWRKYGKKKKV